MFWYEVSVALQYSYRSSICTMLSLLSFLSNTILAIFKIFKRLSQKSRARTWFPYYSQMAAVGQTQNVKWSQLVPFFLLKNLFPYSHRVNSKEKHIKNAFSLHSVLLAWIRSIWSTADVLLLYNGNEVFYNVFKYFYFNTYIAVIGQSVVCYPHGLLSQMEWSPMLASNI